MNQRHKLVCLLSALVVLPIFTLGLIGLHALNSDLKTYQLQESREAAAELYRLDQKIINHLANFTITLKKDVENVHKKGTWALRCTFQETCPPNIKKRFSLIVSFDEYGDQLYPPPETTGQLYSEVGRLKKISNSLSTAKEKLSQLPLLARKNGVWSNYLTPKGHNLLFCWLGKKNITFCAAIDRSGLIEEMQTYLKSIIADHSHNHIRLFDIQQEILWQNKNILSNLISAQRQLSPPLYFWRLERLQNTSAAPSKYPLTLVALTLPVTMLIIFIAFTLFKDQRKVLAEANNRANFAASVSHELRTPLTNLQLYADLILSKAKNNSENQNQVTNKEIIKYSKIIAAETTRLSELVNNSLAIARGNHPSSRQKIKAIPDHIIEETVSRLEPLLKDQLKNISFALHTPNMVKIDRSALEQILVNLLDNARKYADKKNIRISSKIENETFTLTVRDWGPSFSKSLSRSIFKPFSQNTEHNRAQNTAHNIEQNTKTDGFGLGLAVCEQLAKENGGGVKAEQASPGARFIVTLKITAIENE